MKRPLPEFLIVGAQKCGTTTMFRDLNEHPDIYMPGRKEPNVLVNSDDLDEMRAAYATLFARAGATQLRGEASTAYTMKPTYENTANIAAELTGGRCHIIYITRDPVERIVSHYLHEFERGKMQVPFAIALERYPELVHYSRYDWQIEPWIEKFGSDKVYRTTLENYSKNRQQEAENVVRFLGLDPVRLPAINASSRANTRQETKTIKNPVLRIIQQSNLYQLHVKEILPAHVREKMRRRFLGKTELPDVRVTSEEREFIHQSIEIAR